MNTKNIKYSLLADDHLDAAAELERRSYTETEAASKETMAFRLKQAPNFFWGAFDDNNRLIGFINGTLCEGNELQHDSMTTHAPDGRSLCVHSVVVSEELRRQGIATRMFKHYLNYVNDNELDVDRVLLLSRISLVSLYAKCGFTVTRISSVLHGGHEWFEMVYDCVKERLPKLFKMSETPTNNDEGYQVTVILMRPHRYFAPDADEWTRRIAMEAHCTTIFVCRRENAINAFDFRYYSSEIRGNGSCGLISASKVLFDEGIIPAEETIEFYPSPDFVVYAKQAGNKIFLDCPLCDPGPFEIDDSQSTSVKNSLHNPNEADVVYIGDNQMNIVVEVSPQLYDQVNPADLDPRAVITSVLDGGKIVSKSSVEIDENAYELAMTLSFQYSSLGSYWLTKRSSSSVAIHHAYQVRSCTNSSEGSQGPSFNCYMEISTCPNSRPRMLISASCRAIQSRGLLYS